MNYNILFLVFLIFETEFIYFNYNLNLVKNKEEHKSEEIWIHPLFGLMNNIVFVVYFLVMEYFKTFRFCWLVILDTLILLIYGYFDLLKLLITSILSYPAIYYSIIGLAIALFGSYYIVKVLINKL